MKQVILTDVTNAGTMNVSSPYEGITSVDALEPNYVSTEQTIANKQWTFQTDVSNLLTNTDNQQNSVNYLLTDSTIDLHSDVNIDVSIQYTSISKIHTDSISSIQVQCT